MIPLPDSNKEHKEFFCSGCQRHKKGLLFSHKVKNRRYCTTCNISVEEREKMGIRNPYENNTKKQASIKYATQTYKKPFSDKSLAIITGEPYAKTRPS